LTSTVPAGLNNTDSGRINQYEQGKQQKKRSTRINTTNKDFELLIRTIYKKCQLNHYITTWKNFPLALPNRSLKLPIKCQLETVFTGITPPNPDADLRKELNGMCTSTINAISQIVNVHLLKQATSTDKLLGELNPLDSTKAIEIAKRQLDRNLEKKIPAALLNL